jgi:protein TonB
MIRSEPRLAWTTPSGPVDSDPEPVLSQWGAREALWALLISVAVHGAFLVGLGRVLLATDIPAVPSAFEVMVVTADEMAPAAPPRPVAGAAAPPEAVRTPEPAPPAAVAPAPSPPPDVKPPEAALPEAAPVEAAPPPAAKPAETPRKPPDTKPREERPQIAIKPPTPPAGHGVDGTANAKPTELSAVATFKPVVTPAPEYPPIAVQLGEEGTVGLLVEIEADGSPKAVTVQRSSGFGSLDEEAVRAMRLWRFSPPLKNGRAVAGTIYIPMVFKLKHHGG